MAYKGGEVSQLISKAVAAMRSPCSRSGKTVHLALSGGVDSSVSGFLLRERGWDVRPVLMRCWADGDDDGGMSCFEREVRESEAVVKALALSRPLSVFDFVPEYWNSVFNGVLLAGLARGVTPNQDLACNRFIKFGSFPRRLASEVGNAEPPPFATGHYARIERCEQPNETGQSVRLLRAVDDLKDQTYFLASVPGAAFENAIFPVGGLLKSEVRRIAEYVGLPSAKSRSSRGICFVGKRPMGEFLQNYVDTDATGVREHKSMSTGRGFFVLGDARIAELPYPAQFYTIGQRARVGGRTTRLYVTGRHGDDVLLSEIGPRTKEIICHAPHWIGRRGVGEEPRRLGYKGNSSAPVAECTAQIVADGRLRVSFDDDRPAIAPGQVAVLYEKDEVLGAATVDSY